MTKKGLLFSFPFFLHLGFLDPLLMCPNSRWFFIQVACNPLLADEDTGLDTIGCDDGTDSSGNLMTGLACEMVSSSGRAVISGPLVAENEKRDKEI